MSTPLRFTPVENREPPRAVGRDRASSSREHAVSSFPFLSGVYRPDLAPTIAALFSFQPTFLATVGLTSAISLFAFGFAITNWPTGDDNPAACVCYFVSLPRYHWTRVKVPFVTGSFVFSSFSSSSLSDLAVKAPAVRSPLAFM